MADEGCFGRCLYFNISLDVMFCMTKKVVQELHDYFDKFGRSGVVGVLGENITTIVNFLIIVCTKLAEINNLTYKSKFHVLGCFFKLSLDKFRDFFILMFNQEWVADLGNFVGLSNNSQSTLKKINGICVKATTYYTSLDLTNYFNLPNNGSTISC